MTEIIHHPFRQKLLNYSNDINGTLKLYIPKYYKHTNYFNVNLNDIVIRANNAIKATVIFADYLNLKLKTKVSTNRFQILYDILCDDYENNFDENENLIIEENVFNDDDTLWLEEYDGDIGDRKILEL
jgi:hypothetical protein